MKSGKIIGSICVFTLSLFLLAGCSTSNSATNYPVGMKKKRVNYTATSSKTAVVSSSKKIHNSPPKSYVVPSGKKEPLYK